MPLFFRMLLMRPEKVRVTEPIKLPLDWVASTTVPHTASVIRMSPPCGADLSGAVNATPRRRSVGAGDRSATSTQGESGWHIRTHTRAAALDPLPGGVRGAPGAAQEAPGTM